MVRKAVNEERKRPLKPTRLSQPATDVAGTLQKKIRHVGGVRNSSY
jgi:hypothetical protein